MSRESASLEAPKTLIVEAPTGERVVIELVVNPRARRIAVRIDAARRAAIATVPSARQIRAAAQFASERAGWIARELSRVPERTSFMPGALAPLRGVNHELVFEPGRGPARIEPARMESGEGIDDQPTTPKLIAPAPDVALFESRVIRFLKAEAKIDLTRRVQEYSAILGVQPTRIQVKETRSRWGSCTSDGALAFSWRVILAPPFVLDYLAAHETAHLCEMNHSKKFWDAVKKALPDYKRGHVWLDKHGASLHAFGAG